MSLLRITRTIRFFTLVLVVAALNCHAAISNSALAKVEWLIAQEDSFIEATGKVYGADFLLSFTGIDGEIILDPKSLEGSVIDVYVPIVTAYSDSKNVKDNVLDAVWLNSEEHPKARFYSKRILKLEEENFYRAIGLITIRGVTIPLDMDFELLITDDSAIAKTSFQLDRLQFDVGEGEWADDKTVSNIIDVNISILATRVQ